MKHKKTKLPDLVFLKQLVKTKNRNNLIKEASKSNLNLLYQCAKNVLVGNIPLNKRKKKKLSRFKKHFRILASKTVGAKRKLKILNQKGSGLLPGLLSVLTPIIISSIAEIIKNN